MSGVPDGVSIRSGVLKPDQLPASADLLEKAIPATPIAVTGARDETEGALANLLAALATLGLTTNSTTAS